LALISQAGRETQYMNKSRCCCPRIYYFKHHI